MSGVVKITTATQFGRLSRVSRVSILFCSLSVAGEFVSRIASQILGRTGGSNIIMECKLDLVIKLFFGAILFISDRQAELRFYSRRDKFGLTKIST